MSSHNTQADNRRINFTLGSFVYSTLSSFFSSRTTPSPQPTSAKPAAQSTNDCPILSCHHSCSEQPALDRHICTIHSEATAYNCGSGDSGGACGFSCTTTTAIATKKYSRGGGVCPVPAAPVIQSNHTSAVDTSSSSSSNITTEGAARQGRTEESITAQTLPGSSPLEPASSEPPQRTPQNCSQSPGRDSCKMTGNMPKVRFTLSSPSVQHANGGGRKRIAPMRVASLSPDNNRVSTRLSGSSDCPGDIYYRSRNNAVSRLRERKPCTIANIGSVYEDDSEYQIDTEEGSDAFIENEDADTANGSEFTDVDNEDDDDDEDDPLNHELVGQSEAWAGRRKRGRREDVAVSPIRTRKASRRHTISPRHAAGMQLRDRWRHKTNLYGDPGLGSDSTSYTVDITTTEDEASDALRNGSTSTANAVNNPIKRPRGRPRKLRIPEDGGAPLVVASKANARMSPTHSMLSPNEKPREERSYVDFFPDLNLDEQLVVVFDHKDRSDAAASPPPGGNDGAAHSSFFRLRDEASSSQSPALVLTTKKAHLELPKPRFEKVSDKVAEASLARNKFHRPSAHYIRHTEPTETELLNTVEYDLDEEDMVFLGLLNAERSESNDTALTEDVFELIIDQIEKQWFDLIKDTQREISTLLQEQIPAENVACAICEEDECDNSNAIVFCDGCNLAVHQDCYGVPYIPEGQWLCRRCMLSPDRDPECIFCPHRDGAFKKTTSNKWAHLLCALWIPEVCISNTVYMEPVDSVESIPRSRWKLLCSLCSQKGGACIQCSHRQCFTAFHVTCARKAHLYMKVRQDRRTGDPVFRVYCDRHCPSGYAKLIDLDAPAAALRTASHTSKSNNRRNNLLSILRASHTASSDDKDSSRPVMPATSPKLPRKVTSLPRSSPGRGRFLSGSSHPQSPISPLKLGHTQPELDSLEATLKYFDPSAPVVNHYIFQGVLARIQTRPAISNRTALLTNICQYWALKRKAHHGAPLLKRLHLEPWTASATQQKELEMAEEQRQQFIISLRADLERVRMLVEIVRRREREKLKRVRLQMEYWSYILTPLAQLLTPALDEIQRSDPRNVFAQPVTTDIAPDYYQIIRDPLDFGTMHSRISKLHYQTPEQFEADIELVLSNCQQYNPPHTYHHMLAARVRRIAAKVIKRLKENYAQMPVDPNTGHLKVPFNPEIWTYNLTRLPELEKRPEDEKVTTDDPEDDQGKRKEVVQDTEVPSTPVPLTGDSDKEGTRRRKRGWRKELSPLVTRTEPPATRLRSRTGSCHPETPTSGTTPSTDAPKGRRKNVRGWIWVPEAESSESPSPTVPDEEATAVTPTLPRLRSQTTSTGDAEASTPDDSPLKTQEETMLLRPKRKASLSLPQVGRAASPTGFAQMSPPRKRKKSGSLLLTAFEPPQRRPKDFGPDPTKWPVNTLVWAKMQSYPWFPAEIYDPSDPEIPEDVHKDRDELGSSGSNMVLVHFFDRASRRTWKWLEPKFVVQLGIDDKIDKYYYSAKLAKSNHMVQSIRTAYMRACEAIEARHS